MHILAINVGSSSLKFALFTYGNGSLTNVCRGSFKNIGSSGSEFSAVLNGVGVKEHIQAKDLQAALKYLLNRLQEENNLRFHCVVHRIVHGGATLHQPQIIDENVVTALENAIPLAPDHLPSAIEAVKLIAAQNPTTLQIACFDTGFHWNLPSVARAIPLPVSGGQQPMRKYGFHGLSYEYVYAKMYELYADTTSKKIVIAHLGSGCSMAAINEGNCIDTTMGFTPTGGLVMGMRTGDLDPGILFYLLQHGNYTVAELSHTVSHNAGLKAISGLSSDMEILLQAEGENEHAKLAVDVFCYQDVKHLGALIAVTGGVDILVFTGGMGARAPEIRSRICGSMRYAGIELDPNLNERNSAFISTAKSTVAVHVIETNEEEQMAKHALKLITENPDYGLPE